MNFQKPFQVEIDVSGCHGKKIMQGGRHVYYHFEIFHEVVLNYPTYEKELYSLFQVINKWKHYLIVKESIIHIDHIPLQHLQA